MGIIGLLQYIKACLKTRNLRDYKGKTAAVDTYAWLHKIIKGPSGRELILGGPNRYRYVKDCMNRINKIQRLGVKVIMVFDGGPLPCKRGEEQHRKKRREETFEKGKQMLRDGDQAGFKKLSDSIDISPDIANRLITELKKQGIEYIVAPYEADAQLAYLSREGIADIIITEDSDLMAFGAKRMLYKLDFQDMTGSELDLDQLRLSKDLPFNFFTHCMFLTTCILSGCDYLSQISGIGFKTAQKYIGRVSTFRGFIGQLGTKSSDIPLNYQMNFMKAFLTFRFQRVFCPKRRTCVQLNDFSHLQKSLNQLLQMQKTQLSWSSQVINVEIKEFVEMNELDFSFLGEKYSDELMCRIADSDVNPVTYQQYDENFADALAYTEPVNLRTNSLLNNPRGRVPRGRQKQNLPLGQTTLLNNLIKPTKIAPVGMDLDKYQYKSLKNGITFDINPKQSRQLSAPELQPIKRGLMFKQSDEEEESDIELTPEYSQITSQNSMELSNSSGLILQTKSVNQMGKNKINGMDALESIAENLFSAVFTQEYLKSPFSQ